MQRLGDIAELDGPAQLGMPDLLQDELDLMGSPREPPRASGGHEHLLCLQLESEQVEQFADPPEGCRDVSERGLRPGVARSDSRQRAHVDHVLLIGRWSMTLRVPSQESSYRDFFIARLLCRPRRCVKRDSAVKPRLRNTDARATIIR